MRLFAFFFAFLLVTSCGQNRTVDGKRQGRWTNVDTINGVLHISKGRYKDDFERGTWKYRVGNKLVKKEKYKGIDCHTWIYHDNGQVMREGYTQLIHTGQLLHWYYTGDWTEFDTLGKPIEVDTYHLGELINERELK